MQEVRQGILKKRIFGITHEQMQLLRRLGGTSLHKNGASSLVAGPIKV